MMSDRRLDLFTTAGYDKGRSKLWQAAWFTVMNLIFMKWWLPPKIRPIILRLFGASIGQKVFIRHGVRVLWPWKLTVGDHSWIGEGVWILNLEPVVIGAQVCLSQEAFLCTGSHRASDAAFAFDNAPITVLDGAWVCARATVLRGTSIPSGQVVGAGVVVGPASFRST